ncbi:Tetratricopeptide-like helical [Akanthomyces lecanii RCEF 1005]|uniref:Tetratricopeptide-like helical n=1 Tax=Akanthomyces lecanii RCEF 1005 TaxID=1081108 RepID=A0A162JQ12_CORDF|nr:Tetratricopeptide-like helical [Akanthomyces lecanii RCEF 1005]
MEARQTRFSPEHEKGLLEESAERRARANELFNAGDFSAALAQYEQALSSCPDYKHFERAVVHSNTSACLIKLEDWTAAAKAATSSLDALVVMERELGLIPEAKSSPAQSTENSKDMSKDKESNNTTNSGAEADEHGLDGADQAEPPFTPANVPEATKNDIKRIRIKALLRRGRARAEAGGWSNFSGAEEDYKTLSRIPGLTAADAKTARAQLIALPPKTKAAQETEMSEMWGKLRTLGDGMLKPFGLSTSNFQMVKDETTGGYSMNFQGNQGQ